MDTIIKQVIESEYRAQRIIDEVENQRKLAESTLQEEIGKVREDIFSGSNLKAREIKTKKIEQAKVQAAQIMSEARDRASQMQKKLEENRNNWVKSLFENVLNRESFKNPE